MRRWAPGALFIATSAFPVLAQTTGSPATLPVWDVVSVRAADPRHCTSIHTVRYSPDGMTAVCTPLVAVIQQAYALLHPTLILNAPEWVQTGSLWNIDAKVASEDAASYAALKPSEKFYMMRSVLTDRFHMKAHMERREIPVYDLVIAKGGPKLKQATPQDAAKGHLWMRTPGDLEAVDTAIVSLPIMLNAEVGRAIVDKTGLTGRYDFTLKYLAASGAAADDTGGPSIFTAIQEQLGLKLQPAKAPMDVLVIDSIERPSDN